MLMFTQQSNQPQHTANFGQQATLQNVMIPHSNNCQPNLMQYLQQQSSYVNNTGSGLSGLVNGANACGNSNNSSAALQLQNSGLSAHNYGTASPNAGGGPLFQYNQQQLISPKGGSAAYNQALDFGGLGNNSKPNSASSSLFASQNYNHSNGQLFQNTSIVSPSAQIDNKQNAANGAFLLQKILMMTQQPQQQQVQQLTTNNNLHQMAGLLSGQSGPTTSVLLQQFLGAAANLGLNPQNAVATNTLQALLLSMNPQAQQQFANNNNNLKHQQVNQIAQENSDKGSKQQLLNQVSNKQSTQGQQQVNSGGGNLNKRNQKAFQKFESQSTYAESDDHSAQGNNSKKRSPKEEQVKQGKNGGNNNQKFKAKSPSLSSLSSSDESTSSTGRRSRRFTNQNYGQQRSGMNAEHSYQAESQSYSNHLGQSYGNYPQQQQTPHENELKRRRLDVTCKTDYVSIVTRQTTFTPTLPKIFQQASVVKAKLQ